MAVRARKDAEDFSCYTRALVATAQPQLMEGISEQGIALWRRCQQGKPGHAYNPEYLKSLLHFRLVDSQKKSEKCQTRFKAYKAALKRAALGKTGDEAEGPGHFDFVLKNNAQRTVARCAVTDRLCYGQPARFTIYVTLC